MSSWGRSPSSHPSCGASSERPLSLPFPLTPGGPGPGSKRATWKASWRRCRWSWALKLEVAMKTDGKGRADQATEERGPGHTVGCTRAPLPRGQGSLSRVHRCRPDPTLIQRTPHIPFHRSGEGSTDRKGVREGPGRWAPGPGVGAAARTGGDPGVQAQSLHERVVQEHGHQCHQDVGEAHIEHNRGPCGGRPATGAQGEPTPTRRCLLALPKRG